MFWMSLPGLQMLHETCLVRSHLHPDLSRADNISLMRGISRTEMTFFWQISFSEVDLAWPVIVSKAEYFFWSEIKICRTRKNDLMWQWGFVTPWLKVARLFQSRDETFYSSSAVKNKTMSTASVLKHFYDMLVQSILEYFIYFVRSMGIKTNGI